ncbi:signal peptidase I [Thalassotalea ponticola]|uniref:signal peptidase I n=1 Tax=Thalassotalea ponticola TaxID=1523392 RepID=UPI0025B3BA95|nr:signal peptidase I [Thalassotalea ponticola]MDN3652117.1 signal peptidase I [Thalassotalea ponticola]
MAVYFSILLVAITLITGVVYMLDKLVYAPKRRDNLKATQQQCAQPLDEAAVEKILTPNVWVDTSVQIFPVVAFVLILRSFLWEPFQIPSGSMMPTLLDGDFILVDKHSYGLREPVTRHKFVEIGQPERGDVVVFKYPKQPQVDYIKRVIGLPGDRIMYKNKSLYIQPKCAPESDTCPKMTQVLTNFKQNGEYSQRGVPLTRYESVMDNKSHEILINNHTPEQASRFYVQPGLGRGEWLVPEGHYFVMGDNRDNSLDGRFWGFVPEQNLVGKAVAIWMSFDFERQESDLLPTWVPSGVRFSRIGGIE